MLHLIFTSVQDSTIGHYAPEIVRQSTWAADYLKTAQWLYGVAIEAASCF